MLRLSLWLHGFRLSPSSPLMKIIVGIYREIITHWDLCYVPSRHCSVTPKNQFPQNSTKPCTPLSSPPSPIPRPPFIQLPKVKPKVLPLTTPLSTPVVNLKIKSPVFVHSNISYWDFKDFKIVTQYMWVWLVSNSIPRAAWL